MLIKQIIIKNRYRKDYGDLEPLKESIKRIGLLHPVVINEENVLVAGGRRLKALKELGHEDIPVTKINLKDVIRGEYDENSVRKGFTPSEEVAIWQSMESYQETGIKKPPSESDGGEPRQRAAKFLGKSTDTLSKAKQIVDSGDEELIKRMDDTGNVSLVYKKLKKDLTIQARRTAKHPIAAGIGLVHGDSATELKTIEADRVDCVVMDPPYNINFESYTKSSLDFEDNINLDKFEDIIKELHRVMKADSHLYCFAGFQTLTEFTTIIKQHFQIRNVLVWVKNNFTPTDFSYNYAHQYEFIIFASKGQRYLNNKSVKEFNGTPLNEVKKTALGKSSDVLQFKNLTNKKHSGQKPTDLLSYLICNSTVEGEIVLDCFAGSGSTLVAAEKNARQWIGIELNEDCINICKERLNNEEDTK